MLGQSETIAAISTARGIGALGVVRISGKKTPEILKACFSSRDFSLEESHRGFFGTWKDSTNEEPIDEVVVLLFKEGRGFTGELAVDIICHGGNTITEMILQSILQAGARLARPGEFSFRAVMNGRIDLAQAENILDIIHAKSPKAARQALGNLQGALSNRLSTIEQTLTHILAHLEAAIDFTHEDIQPDEYSNLVSQLDQVCDQITTLLDTYMAGQVTNQGLRVVIAGQPNAGKSSIYNDLLGNQKSIVTKHPGTTRDVLEADILINQRLVKLVDTAGLRLTNDEIEKLGVEKTRNEMQSADLVLFVVDSAAGLNNSDVELLSAQDPKETLICFNKSDLKKNDWVQELRKFGLSEFDFVTSTVLEDSGLDSLRSKISKQIDCQTVGEFSPVVTTQRQKQALGLALEKTKIAQGNFKNQMSPELIAVDLQDSLVAIKDVLGKQMNDEVLDTVFQEFCIGK